MSCLGIVVCVLTHTSINMKWSVPFDTRVNRPLRYCCILASESVLHIPVGYYLSVHNSGKIYLQHHHWYYIYTYIYTIYLFFWIADYLWWRFLKFLLSILKLFGWDQHDSLPPASSKHHSLHTPCPCKQALTHTQCYRQGYW
jgi:hypothetical protein